MSMCLGGLYLREAPAMLAPRRTFLDRAHPCLARARVHVERRPRHLRRLGVRPHLGVREVAVVDDQDGVEVAGTAAHLQRLTEGSRLRLTVRRLRLGVVRVNLAGEKVWVREGEGRGRGKGRVRVGS